LFLVTIKEYHSHPGFKSMKMAWDTRSFCREEEGRLKQGNMKLGCITGDEVSQFCLSKCGCETKCKYSKHVKAMVVVETWRTKN
jgi:hypothetical protein